MTTLPPACLKCVHFRHPVVCDAFPDRIPDIIWIKGDSHINPIVGDHGIQFEVKDDIQERDSLT